LGSTSRLRCRYNFFAYATACSSSWNIRRCRGYNIKTLSCMPNSAPLGDGYEVICGGEWQNFWKPL
jgi:hypothetical protein